MPEMRNEAPNGMDIGAFVRRVVRGFGKDEHFGVNVIFCPGMGNGHRHNQNVWYIWRLLGMQYDNWTRFGNGGQDYMDYVEGTGGRELLGGTPLLKEEKLCELCELIKGQCVEKPVVLIGFSAGAYLCMRAAIRMKEAKLPLILLCFGHTLMVSDLWQEVVEHVPGVIMFGEREMSMDIYVNDIGSVDLSDLAHGPDADEVSTVHFGSYAGSQAQCARVSRTFPRCMVLVAEDCGHNLGHYKSAIKYGKVRALTPPF